MACAGRSTAWLGAESAVAAGRVGARLHRARPPLVGAREGLPHCQSARRVSAHVDQGHRVGCPVSTHNGPSRSPSPTAPRPNPASSTTTAVSLNGWHREELRQGVKRASAITSIRGQEAACAPRNPSRMTGLSGSPRVGCADVGRDATACRPSRSVGQFGAFVPRSVSYTHLTLPTNREV